MIVAIDGPAGAGKSTVARALAERLGFRYLDTGAMYRAVTWLAMQRGVDLGDAERARPARPRGAGDVRRRRPRLDRRHGRDVVDPRPAHRPHGSRRRAASAVREVMRERQRQLGREGNVVIEGRDIGTVVAPDAAVKVYLTADRDERARRRSAERPGIGADALATDLRMRDESDAARMQPAEDAHQIDTTSLDVEDVVEQIEALVRERIAV